MSPKEWLQERGRIKSFVEKYGFNRIAIHRQTTGRVMPQLNLMEAFWEDSRGRIGLSDWIEVAQSSGLLSKKRRKDARIKKMPHKQRPAAPAPAVRPKDRRVVLADEPRRKSKGRDAGGQHQSR